MAFSVKRDGVKQVPWFSLTEWHQVYKQIYSNDTVEQTNAYERLLAWKARMPKLPVGVDCTLSIMQVCLRDREWTPKIDSGQLPISYENDLCLMYSTTIMRFLNHISNIGHTKQTSLFQIAKKLNIPEWIVNLRHDAAHGHELPSIGVLRTAVNTLLIWLHEEYWLAEATANEDDTNEVMLQEGQDNDEVQAFSDLIELWTAVSLYIHAGYELVSNIPDLQLQDTLQDLRTFAIGLSEQNNRRAENEKDNYIQIARNNIKKDARYTLETARTILLSEISRYLSKKSTSNKENVVFEALFNTEAFLPSEDVLQIFSQNQKRKHKLDGVLPMAMLAFWKDIIYVLQEQKMMESLILRLVTVTQKEDESEHKRLLASMWLSSICYSFVKLDIAHRVSQTLEYKWQNENKKLQPNLLETKIKEKTDNTNPRFRDVLWLNLSDIIPSCLTDMDFVSKLILNANQFTAKFIAPILELVTPRMDKHHKDLLLNLMNIYTEGKVIQNTNSITNVNKELFTVEDLHQQHNVNISQAHNQYTASEKIVPCLLADKKVRNPHWKLALENYQWAGCPIGVLPWQIDTLEFLSPTEATTSKCDTSTMKSEVVPGIIDTHDLKMKSQIDWENVLRKKKKLKKKHEKRTADVIINRALETAKKQT